MLRQIFRPFVRMNPLVFSSFSSKPGGYHFDFGSHEIPHPVHAKTGVEDAIYCSPNLLVIADGASEAVGPGQDSGKYPRALLKNIDKIWKEHRDTYRKKPKGLIVDGAKLTKEHGRSTCCILNIEEDENVLYTSLIGDSGYRVFRPNKNAFETVHVSAEHNKDYYFPYQIGTEGDDPETAIECRHELHENDLLVIGTDGTFDNLFDRQMIEFLKNYMQEDGRIPNIQEVAKKFVEFIYDHSINPTHGSPFAMRENLENIAGDQHTGGKMDDITVILAQIRKHK